MVYVVSSCILHFSVFMLTVAESLPETSEFIPLLSEYFEPNTNSKHFSNSWIWCSLHLILLFSIVAVLFLLLVALCNVVTYILHGSVSADYRNYGQPYHRKCVKLVSECFD